MKYIKSIILVTITSTALLFSGCGSSGTASDEPLLGSDAKPVITLIGGNVNISQGSSYSELGATATDKEDGDITDDIVIDSNNVNTSVVGVYTVTYDVNDSYGNAADTKTRTVNVEDDTKPVITLKGDNPQNIEIGDTYVEQNATATDNNDGDITDDIIIDSSDVNTSAAGTYYVYYDVKDSAGNAADRKTRTVNVASSGLDTSFNSTGLVTSGGTNIDRGNAIATDSNGKIYIAGDIRVSPYGINDFDMIIWSYDVDGTPNETFGNGIVTHNDAAGGNSFDYGKAIAIHNDIIYVAGQSKNDLTSDGSMAIWSYDLNGSFNETFGTAGIITENPTDGVNDDDMGSGITIASNNIYVAGYIVASGNYDMAIWSYDLNGNPNKGFNTSGVLTYNSGGAGSDKAHAITSSGDKIYVTGYSNGTASDMTIWSYDLNGSLNTTFGGGIVTHNNAAGGNSADIGLAIVTDSADNIYVTGYSNKLSSSPWDRDLVVWKYTSAGILDTSFGGGDGIVTYASAGTDYDEGHGIRIDANGNIIVTGISAGKMITIVFDSNGDIAQSSFTTSGYYEHDTTSVGNGLILNDDESKLYITGIAGSGTAMDMSIWAFEY